MKTSPRVLCVDAGNTQVKFALVSEERHHALGAVPTERAAERVAYEPLRRQQKLLRSVDGVMVSSVVPSLNGTISRILHGLTGVQPMFVHHRLCFPFRIGVPHASQLGVDRLCAAAGALGRRASSAIIIDVGSAITVDLVDRRIYRGGLIMAGPSLGLKALGSFAEQLPAIDYGALKTPFPKRSTNTRDSMVLGASIAAVGAIRQAVAEREALAGRHVKKTVTGGAALPLRARLPRSYRFDAGIVQKGLFRLWQLNLGD